MQPSYDLIELIGKQEAFFRSGQTLSYAFRLSQLKKLGEACRRYEAELIQALADDLGKHPTEAFVSELSLIYSEIKTATRNLKRWMRPKRVRTPMALRPARSSIQSEPFGRCLIIGPWNYPIQLVLVPLVGAIAAGNVFTLKPSEFAPASAAILSKILSEIYPAEYCCVLQGDAKLSQELLRERWDHIFFTGSTTVGRHVAKAAAEYLCPTVLELGGKSPCIVTEHANLKVAARRIIFGKLLNAGQTCAAPDYVLVANAIHEPLIDALKKEIHLRFGPQPLDNNQLGRIINATHFQRLLRLMDPEKIVVGGQTDAVRLRIAPTLMSEVKADDAVMQEEIFGPILPIIKFTSLKEAKDFVRAREKPLSLYIFTEDKNEQMELSQTLSFGGGCINDTVIHLSNEHLPFGGVGSSGMGHYHGFYSFECFSHKKSILKNPSYFDAAIRYQPWTKWKERILRLILA